MLAVLSSRLRLDANLFREETANFAGFGVSVKGLFAENYYVVGADFKNTATGRDEGQ